MFPRSACPRCRRSFAVNKDGELRSHFCPHYRTCEPGQCSQCLPSTHADQAIGATEAHKQFPVGVPNDTAATASDR